LELKEEKVSALNRELEELTFGGNTEEEIAQLKRSKLEFEKRCKEQEEELDEMAGQIQVNFSFQNNGFQKFEFIFFETH
jgi:myosin-18